MLQAIEAAERLVLKVDETACSPDTFRDLEAVVSNSDLFSAAGTDRHLDSR